MKINPRELRDKGIKYCEEHSEGVECGDCPLKSKSMCVTSGGIFAINTVLDIFDFCRDFQKMVSVIYGEEAADGHKRDH